MTYTTEQFIATSQDYVATLQGVTSQAFAGFEKLVELNVATSKAAVAESFSHAQAVLGVKGAQELLAVQAAALPPLAEKSVAYGRHAYGIASSMGAEWTKTLEARLAEVQKTLAAAVDKAAKSAPAGSEAAAALFKSTLNATQSAIESAKTAAKHAVELAESNLATATDRVVEAATVASKKR
ncbi:MAG: TIGR01841 family phasin [Burkholderiaceae bacterium]